MHLVNQLTVERNTRIFSEDCKREIEAIMHPETFVKGSSIYWEGDDTGKLFYLREGKVRLTKVSDEGKEIAMYYYFPGDMFGEYLPDQHPLCAFTAEVLEDTTVGVIRRKELEQLMKENGTLALEFTQWLSHTQQYTHMKLRDLLLYGKNGALASMLIRISNTYGQDDGEEITISRKFTNMELAKMVGATRETVNRLLTGFKKDGLIDYEQGKISILNLGGLKEINQCEECPVEICRL
ncbi:Crp/Fnr family transcriptional regulator [Virgibacillus xinjiangensis]|uniref:Crp/Fnr family transcriptional regulator n=1 Tax=Virgibacillus xinjiangensis TaxID=393090 RepID=A0ABV7CWF3_9BACI